MVQADTARARHAACDSGRRTSQPGVLVSAQQGFWQHASCRSPACSLSQSAASHIFRQLPRDSSPFQSPCVLALRVVTVRCSQGLFHVKHASACLSMSAHVSSMAGRRSPVLRAAQCARQTQRPRTNRGLCGNVRALFVRALFVRGCAPVCYSDLVISHTCACSRRSSSCTAWSASCPMRLESSGRLSMASQGLM